jgi:hypothetical protein
LWIAASLRFCGIWYVVDEVIDSAIKVRQGRTVALHLFSRTPEVWDLDPKGRRICDPRR